MSSPAHRSPTMAIEGVPVAWELRRDLFTLDPRVTHLNHGSFGAVPAPVQRAQQRLRDEVEANPMAFFTRGLLDRIAHTRAHLARFLGADPAGAALVPNATAAATAVLRSVNLAAGQEILLTDHAYGAVRLSAQEVAARVGATVRVVAVPLDSRDEEVIARVIEAVRPGRTRLAIIDQVSSPTAKQFPIDRLVAELRRREVPVLVDAAHAPGMLEVELSAPGASPRASASEERTRGAGTGGPAAIGADFWLGNLHKWAFAPRPTALLVVAPEHRAGMRPLVVSWEQPYGFPRAQEFAGTLDYTSWLAAPSGVHLLRTLQPERVRAHNNELAAHGQRVVAEAIAARWPVTGPSDRGRAELLEQARAGLLGSDAVSMRLVPLPPRVADEPATAAALQARLATEHRIEVALAPWNGMGLLRLSAQVYNRIDDYARLARALDDLLSP